jgi:galactose mutarotase-like enzyme
LSAWRGLDVVRLSADDATLVIVPSRGGKLASLEFSGSEWLLQPAPVPPPPAAGSPFVDAGLWGWDEMLPTIDPCTIAVDGAQRSLPDHGEVWTEAWTVDGDALACSGRALPYRVERTAAVSGPSAFSLSYRLTTSSADPVPVLWAAHPQFRARPGCQAVLPEEVTSVLDVHAPDGPVGRAWSPEALWELAEGGSAKLYVPPEVRVGWAGLIQADRRWLRLRWDADVVPYLGIWLDRSSLAREPVIALEPATGFYDSLARAVDAGRTAWVSADAPLTWRLDVDVGGGPPPWAAAV